MDDGDCGPPQFDNSDRLDELLDALADRCRRHTLYYLKQEEQAELDEIASTITPRLHDTPVDELADSAIQKITIELHHVHLPKLAKTGIIEYDPRSDATMYRTPPKIVETFLEYCAEREARDYYSSS